MFNRFAKIQSKQEQEQEQEQEELASTEQIKLNESKKRIAHMPVTIKTINSSDAAKQLPKRPVLPLELGGKVPNAIRQRYLNLIIDECLKINQVDEEAYERALNEEKTIYKRSPSKNTYISLAANTIKRIRDSMKAKDA